MNEALQVYINQQLAAGVSRETLIQNLKAQGGWTDADLAAILPPLAPSLQTPLFKKKSFKIFLRVQIILFVAFVVSIVAGVSMGGYSTYVYKDAIVNNNTYCSLNYPDFDAIPAEYRAGHKCYAEHDAYFKAIVAERAPTYFFYTKIFLAIRILFFLYLMGFIGYCFIHGTLTHAQKGAATQGSTGSQVFNKKKTMTLLIVLHVVSLLIFASVAGLSIKNRPRGSGAIPCVTGYYNPYTKSCDATQTDLQEYQKQQQRMQRSQNILIIVGMINSLFLIFSTFNLLLCASAFRSKYAINRKQYIFSMILFALTIVLACLYFYINISLSHIGQGA